MSPSHRLIAGPQDLTALEALRSVATGRRSVSEVLGAALERVAETEGELGAWRSIDEAAVRARAKLLDTEPSGALRGVLVGVKDVIDTADAPTGYGSPLFAEHQPSADADAVACLRAAGAIVLGKTESTELAMFQPAGTRNPYDVARTPGGSSSGSAAAVASGTVPVALGTQTAGSVVRPAAYCGIYGFKPSRGWTSTAGIWLLAESLDTLGVFARRAGDLRLVYEVLRSPEFSQPARRRPASSGGGRRRSAAVLRATEWGDVDEDVLGALGQVATALRGAGWTVEEMAMPPAWLRLPEHHATVMAAEVAHNLHGALGEQVELISENAKAIVERGDATPARDYLASLRATREAAAFLPALAASVDVLLTPSALGVAPEGLGFTGDPVMCRPWTLLGLPCSNVPAVRRQDGLPVGVQVVGPAYDDLAFLEDLAAIEAGTLDGG